MKFMTFGRLILYSVFAFICSFIIWYGVANAGLVNDDLYDGLICTASGNKYIGFLVNEDGANGFRYGSRHLTTPNNWQTLGFWYSDGSYNAGGLGDCANKSMATLFADGQAFNIVQDTSGGGGGGGTFTLPEDFWDGIYLFLALLMFYLWFNFIVKTFKR